MTCGYRHPDNGGSCQFGKVDSSFPGAGGLCEFHLQNPKGSWSEGDKKRFNRKVIDIIQDATMADFRGVFFPDIDLSGIRLPEVNFCLARFIGRASFEDGG